MQEPVAAAAATAAEKVIVRCQPVGAVPRLKQTKSLVDGSKPFAYVIDFLQRQTKRERLFVYCNASFAPSPGVTLAELYVCFSKDSTLVVNYCDQQAYG